MPARDEQRVHSTHTSSITRICIGCPRSRAFLAEGTRRAYVWHHVHANITPNRPYSVQAGNLTANQSAWRWRIAGSALADPAQRRLGRPGREVLAITPGTAGAVLMVTLPARNADHGSFLPTSTGHGHRASVARARLLGGDAQAALARRIRRRRSAARSSSFRPPQTPYFSGRDSA